MATAMVAAAIVCLVPAAASARPRVGVQGISSDPARVGNDLDSVKSARLGVIRVQAMWSALEPDAAGRYDADALAALDRVVDGAAARGIKVVLFADATPCWASAAPASMRGSCSGPTTPAVYRYPPRDPKTFAAFSAFLAKRYGRKLAAYEVWNEPDQSNQLYFAGPDKVARYVAMVKAAYRPVKRAAPGIKVLAGSFVGNNGRWLAAMYKRGVRGYYDGLAVHFYFHPLADLARTRAVQRRHGDRKPMWLTEFGWTSCYSPGGPSILAEHVCLSQAGQAQALSYVIRALAHTSWVQAAIVYNLRDEDAAYRFGLFDAQGAKKPAYAAVARAAKSSGRPPAPSIRIGDSRGQLVVSGRGAIADSYSLRLTQGGRLRYRATLTTDRFAAYRFKLPPGVPTRGIRLTIRSDWTGRSASATR